MNHFLREILRRSAARVFASALHLHSWKYIPVQGPILVIAPHPDDEVLGCAGAICTQLEAGYPVSILYMSDGGASHLGHPTLSRAQLEACRRDEAVASLAALGLTATAENVYFLHLPDGELDRLSESAASAAEAAIAEKIMRLRPLAVFSPYINDGSTEHAAASALVRRALAATGGGLLYEYPVWAWWRASRLTERLHRSAQNLRLPMAPFAERRARALACHRSQTRPTAPWTAPVLPAALTAVCLRRNEYYFCRPVPGATEVKSPMPASLAAAP